MMMFRKMLPMAALVAALLTGAVSSQTITVKNDGNGWDGLTVTLVAEGGACTNKALHRAFARGNGDYVFSGVKDGEYVLCVNKDVAVDVSVSDGGTVITPDVLDFDGE